MSERPRRGTPPPDSKRPSRPRLRNQILFAFGILALAAGAFYTALIVANQINQIFFPGTPISLGPVLGKIPGLDSGSSSSSDASGSRINILVMGLDRRPYEGNAATRTDTMFVVTVDPSTHTVRGLGMPRDLFVDIPTKSGNSTFKERINTAYEYGELQGYSGGGGNLAKKVVGNLLGIKINYYVVIDFQGFKQVIDMLGGVDVDVAKPGVNDPYYSDTEKLGDFYPCVFSAGLHHMNGLDALCYSRTRFNTSDLDRILKQQRVIFAVLDKATQLNVLSDPANILSLWKRYKSTVTTDINDLQIPGFAKLATSIDPNQLAFLSIGAATTPYTTSDGAAVLLPSTAGIKQIVDAFISDNHLQQDAAVVQVVNATGRAGHAAKAVEYFGGLGIPTASLITVDTSAVSQTRTDIIEFASKDYTAERLAAWLSVSKDRVRKATDADAALRNPTADIVVVLGTDAKLESTLAETTTP